MGINMERYEAIMKDWDWNKNKTIYPNDITSSSKEEVWWKCHHCSFEWVKSIASRCKSKSKCPQCKKIEAQKVKRQKLIAKQGSLEDNYPHIAREWHYEKNHPLLPSEINYGASDDVWWIGTCQHEWQQPVDKRTQRNYKCPYCSGRKVGYGNSLGDQKPEVANHWHPEKNGLLTPFDVTPRSSKRAWWKCNCGEEWEAVISSITNDRANIQCVKCAYQVVSEKTSERFLKNNGSLQEHNPALAKQWHPFKNRKTPYDYTQSSKEKVWWLCEQGHEWKTSIGDRNDKITGCPECKKEWKTSFPEQAIYFYLKKEFSDAENRSMVTDGNGETIELDIYIPSIKIGIEYDGYIYHKNKKEKDENKNKLMQETGIQLIRIREKNLEKLTKYGSDEIFRTSSSLSELNEVINELRARIENKSQMNLSIALEVNCKKDQTEILSSYRQEIKKRSVASRFPDIAKQWHPTKNKGLKPTQVSYGSKIVVWWTCEKNHEYDMEVQQRVGNGCPYCAGKRIDETNSLQALFPEVAKEWDIKKNTLRANEVAPGSAKKYWWICQTCHYEWDAAPNDRTRPKRPSGCKPCSLKKQVEKRIKNKIEKEGSLADNEPAVAAEWHPTRNAPLTPQDVLTGSNKEVWWQGKCGHEWAMTVYSRTNKNPERRQNCPTCARKRGAVKRVDKALKNGNSLAANIPTLAKEWHVDKNAPLTPHDVTFSSTKEVWWKCENGHEWAETVTRRSRNKKMFVCPQCMKMQK